MQSPGPFWAAAFWLTYVVWFAGEVRIFARDKAQGAGEIDDRRSRRLIVVAIVVALAIAFLAARRFPAARLPAPADVLVPAGVALMWTGLALRHWAVRTLGAFFTTQVSLKAEHRLVTGGPYARLRHPAYTGAVVTCVGLGVALGNRVSLGVMALVPLLAFVNRIRIEEAVLDGRFGPAWDAYRAPRWALIPPLW